MYFTYIVCAARDRSHSVQQYAMGRQRGVPSLAVRGEELYCGSARTEEGVVPISVGAVLLWSVELCCSKMLLSFGAATLITPFEFAL